MGYEPIARPRYDVEPAGTGEQIRVRVTRQVWPMLFLPVWLAGWTAGGIAAITSLFVDFQPFLVFWLCGWALGWVMAVGSLAWMFGGSETIRVVGGDLEVAHHMLGFSRRWLYEGSRVRNLRLAEQPSWPVRSQLQIPFLNFARGGVVKFDYGPRTIGALQSLDEAEGRAIIERLRQRLPSVV